MFSVIIFYLVSQPFVKDNAGINFPENNIILYIHIGVLLYNAVYPFRDFRVTLLRLIAWAFQINFTYCQLEGVELVQWLSDREPSCRKCEFESLRRR